MLENIVPVSIRNPKREAEISWFCDICGGDTEFLSTLDVPEDVLLNLPSISIPKVQNRIPLTTPITPLTLGNLR